MGRHASRFEVVYKHGKKMEFLLFIGFLALAGSSTLIYQSLITHISSEILTDNIIPTRRGGISLVGLSGMLIIFPAYWLVQLLRGKKFTDKNDHGRTLDGEAFTIVMFALSAIYVAISLLVMQLGVYG